MNKPDEFPADANTAAGDNAVQWAQARGAASRIVEHSRAQRRRKRQVRQAFAGGALALMLLAASRLWPTAPVAEMLAPTPRPTLVVSLPARQVLPDGSVVELKEDA